LSDARGILTSSIGDVFIPLETFKGIEEGSDETIGVLEGSDVTFGVVEDSDVTFRVIEGSEETIGVIEGSDVEVSFGKSFLKTSIGIEEGW
jgi:hypothetical protein